MDINVLSFIFCRNLQNGEAHPLLGENVNLVAKHSNISVTASAIPYIFQVRLEFVGAVEVLDALSTFPHLFHTLFCLGVPQLRSLLHPLVSMICK